MQKEHKNSVMELSDFAEYLLENDIVSQEKQKYYVYWLRTFLSNSSSTSSSIWQEKLKVYISYMHDTGKYQNWQILQAEQAIRLYFTDFLKRSTGYADAEPENRFSSANTPSDISLDQLLRRFDEEMRLRNYALRTIQTYKFWVKQFLVYCRGLKSENRKPVSPIDKQVKGFLAHLAIKKNVSSSTQNLAFNALILFFRLVYDTELGDLKDGVRATQSRKIPVVFSYDEVKQLLANINGMNGLMLKVIYGGGLRVNECCRLRIKDIDFDQHLIFVRDGKGGKSRSTILPQSLLGPLRKQVKTVLEIHERDLDDGFGRVWLPDALARIFHEKLAKHQLC